MRCDYLKHCCNPIRYRVTMKHKVYRYCVKHFALTGLKPARDYR